MKPYLKTIPNYKKVYLDMDYRKYIKSNKWRNKSKGWRQKYKRCALFPWLKSHTIHHMTYKNLGKEKYRIDVISLSFFAHSFIHSMDTADYPNLLQKIIHLWCRIPLFIKIIFLFFLLQYFVRM